MSKQTLNRVLFCVLALFLISTIAHAYHHRQPYSKSATLKIKALHAKAIKPRKGKSFAIAVHSKLLPVLGFAYDKVFCNIGPIVTLVEFNSFQNKSPPSRLS